MRFLMILFVSAFLLNSQVLAQVPKDTTKPWFTIADSAVYTGNYKVEGQEFNLVKVVVKEGSLYFYAGQYEGALEPMTTKDNFLAMGQVPMVFSRDEKNQVSGFKADTGDNVVIGKKEKPAEAVKQ